MRYMPLRVSVLSILLLATMLRADTVTLNDGTTLDGDVKRTNDGFTVKLADGSSRTVNPRDVKSLSIGGGSSHGEQGASASLSSLRRAVENLNDIDAIITRYQRFIDANKTTAAGHDAEADLQMWQQRKADGFVHHGGHWVRPDEVAALVGKANDLVEDARDLLRSNKIKEADQTLLNALALDPQNPPALYLHGVIAYRSDKLVDARKAFEAVNAAQPNYPPALNNIAVVLYRQNAVAPALTFYDQAMQASGVNKFILDNVAQTLGVLTEEQKKSPAATKAFRRFAELDTVLQQQLAQKGLYRWGGSWLTQKQLDDLKAGEKDVRDQITALQKQFDDNQARMRQIDLQISANQAQMADMMTRNSYIDKNGTPVSVPLPQIYYQLDSQNSALLTEKKTLEQHVPEMQQQAHDLQARVQHPTYTGVQQIVGLEGMPEIVSTTATQPTMDLPPEPTSKPE